jgi:pectate lyase
MLRREEVRQKISAQVHAVFALNFYHFCDVFYQQFTWRKSMKRISSKSAVALFACTLLGIGSQALASDGYAGNVTGGAGGTSVTATTAAQLIADVASTSPMIITVSGTITLSDNCRVASNKTIQGANSSATINGDLFIGPGSTSGTPTTNVIVQNLTLTDPNGVGDSDGISVKNGSNHIFITHCTFTDCKDGSCDITEKSDFVTLSWCLFKYPTLTGHDFCDLIGASDSQTGDAGKLHVTMHHNWYSSGCHERMPSDRYGTVHVYNNYYNCTGNLYCVRSRIDAQVLCENNYFDGVTVPMTIYVTSGTKGKLKATGNTLVNCTLTNGTDTEAPGTDSVFTPPYSYTLDPAANVKAEVMASAGHH